MLTEMKASRKLLVAIDESEHATAALHWALRNIARPEDYLYIVTVLAPIAAEVYPVAPIATAAAVSAVTHSWEMQRRQEEAIAHKRLTAAAAMAESGLVQIPHLNIHCKVLPAAGGASGVAESIVEYADGIGADVVVIGSRGMGAVKRSMLSLIGLGSVSDYVAHRCKCTTLVVQPVDPQAAAATPPHPFTVCVAADDSQHSQAALQWVLRTRLVQAERGDMLRIISTALPVPYPYPVMDESAAVMVAVAETRTEEMERSRELARSTAQHAVKVALDSGLPASAIAADALEPDGGASDVGESICRYAKSHHVDLVVLGSRGMGAFRRSLMSLIGLGSVSDYVLHHLHVPVAVVKDKALAPPPAAAPEAAAAEAAAPAEATAPRAEPSGVAAPDKTEVVAGAAAAATKPAPPSAPAAPAGGAPAEGKRPAVAAVVAGAPAGVSDIAAASQGAKDAAMGKEEASGKAAPMAGAALAAAGGKEKGE